MGGEKNRDTLPQFGGIKIEKEQKNEISDRDYETLIDFPGWEVSDYGNLICDEFEVKEIVGIPREYFSPVQVISENVGNRLQEEIPYDEKAQARAARREALGHQAIHKTPQEYEHGDMDDLQSGVNEVIEKLTEDKIDNLPFEQLISLYEYCTTGKGIGEFSTTNDDLNRIFDFIKNGGVLSISQKLSISVYIASTLSKESWEDLKDLLTKMQSIISELMDGYFVYKVIDKEGLGSKFKKLIFNEYGIEDTYSLDGLRIFKLESLSWKDKKGIKKFASRNIYLVVCDGLMVDEKIKYGELFVNQLDKEVLYDTVKPSIIYTDDLNLDRLENAEIVKGILLPHRN